jgi:Flp pilus assembly protein TadG
MRAHRRQRSGDRRGSVIVEFALVVPFLFIIVFAVIDFSRAYSQLNAINAGLREGARFASTWKDLVAVDPTAAVRAKVQQSASVFGYNSLDMTKVAVTNSGGANPEYVTVTVTAHPVPLPVLGKFLGIAPFTVTRSVTYRHERAGSP